MPATPLPLRTKSMNAARRASVVALSPALSRKQPVVLERKIASYCLRFSVVKTAGSHDVSEVQPPVFFPNSSTAFAASGIDECWYPEDGMREKIRTLCAFRGLAGAAVGNAAIICTTSLGHGTVGCWLRPPHGSFKPGAVAPATNSVDPPRPNPPPNPAPAPPAPAAGGACGPSAAFSAVESCCWVTEPDFWVSAASYHAANVVLSSAAVTAPSLSPSKIVKSCGPIGAPPRPPPA